jgi:hypothetical protein
LPSSFWHAESEDPEERRGKAEGELRRLKRLTPQQRHEERISEAEYNLEGVKRDAELNVNLAKGELEASIRQAQRSGTAYLEGSKLYFDAFRTGATLAIGSIGGVTAVAGLLGPGLDYIPIIVASVVFLLVSVLSALGGMRFVSALVYTVLGTSDPDRITQSAENNENKLQKRENVSSWCLSIGILLFAIFALLNLAFPDGEFLEVVRKLYGK